MTAATPLPANSRKLANGRFEAWIGNAAGPGRWTEIAEGRFVTLDAAKAWADREYPDATRVQITRFRAAEGWQARLVCTRVDGEWSA